MNAVIFINIAPCASNNITLKKKQAIGFYIRIICTTGGFVILEQFLRNTSS